MRNRLLVLVVCTTLFSVGCANGPATQHSESGNAASAGALTFDEGIAQTVAQLVAPLSERFVVAVTSFPDISGREVMVGRYVAEGLIAPLVATGQFSVVERQLLAKIDEEQELSLTSKIDPDSAMELGKILGVDAIVSGTVSEFGQIYRINTRLISAETGAILSAAKVDVLKTAMGGQPVADAFSSGGTSDRHPDELLLDAQSFQAMDVVSGDWQLDEDRLPNGEIGTVLRQKDLGRGRTLYFGNPEMTDYEFSFYLKANSARTRPVFSALFRNKEPWVYYEFAIGEDYRSFQRVSTHRVYYRSSQESRGILYNARGGISIGVWHHIEIRAEGDNITCSLDGSLIYQGEHAGSYKGRVGFITHETDVSFADIRLREL